ncbi:MAG: hypothetical protein AAB410_05175 [Patescibacteria group bacterium]|mgnify:CR=1 FL=1
MNYLPELNKNLKGFSLGLLNLLFLTTPGFLTFFIFDKDLFIKIELSKLVILSISIIAPFVIFNFFYFQKTDEKLVSGQEPSAFTTLTIAIFLSILVLDLGIFLKYILSLNIKLFLLLTILIQVLASIILSIIHIPKKRFD